MNTNSSDGSFLNYIAGRLGAVLLFCCSKKAASTKRSLNNIRAIMRNDAISIDGFSHRCSYVYWYFTIVVQCYNLYIRRDYNAQDNNSSCYRIAIAIYYYPYQKCFNKRFGLTIEPLPKKSNLMSVQRMKNEGADQPANFITLVIR